MNGAQLLLGSVGSFCDDKGTLSSGFSYMVVGIFYKNKKCGAELLIGVRSYSAVGILSVPLKCDSAVTSCFRVLCTVHTRLPKT